MGCIFNVSGWQLNNYAGSMELVESGMVAIVIVLGLAPFKVVMVSTAYN